MLEQMLTRIGNEYSKEIYENRILYSITKDIKYIKRVVNMTPEGRLFARLIDSVDSCFIFGAGEWGKEILSTYPEINCRGLIDNKLKEDETAVFHGYNVYSYEKWLNDYSEKSSIIISSRLYYPEIYNQLRESGIPDSRIINAGMIINSMSKRQYFDLNEMTSKMEKEECFVDAGGFDGLSSIGFFNWVRTQHVDDYSFSCKSYIFEPDKQNAEKCEKNLRDYCNGTNQYSKLSYEVIRLGLWNMKTTLSFQANSNGSSKVNDDGPIHINVNCLDNVLKDQTVTFIKMDLEGSEYNALLGCRSIIDKQKPKLAISLYHKTEDIWVIPEQICKFRSDYKFYLGHYSLASAETVLYAI